MDDLLIYIVKWAGYCSQEEEYNYDLKDWLYALPILLG
jgi:hypothetical protein